MIRSSITLLDWNRVNYAFVTLDIIDYHKIYIIYTKIYYSQFTALLPRSLSIKCDNCITYEKLLIRSETFRRSCFIITRVKGRVIRFEYVKDQLTPEELESQREQELKELVEGNKVSWFSNIYAMILLL